MAAGDCNGEQAPSSSEEPVSRQLATDMFTREQCDDHIRRIRQEKGVDEVDNPNATDLGEALKM